MDRVKKVIAVFMKAVDACDIAVLEHLLHSGFQN